MVGPGQQHKEAVFRSVIYTQVSISGQALIFMTRTAGTNNWCFVERIAILLLVAFVFADRGVGKRLDRFLGLPTGYIAVIGCCGGYTLNAWLRAIVWHFLLDLVKFSVNYLINNGAGTYSPDGEVVLLLAAGS